MSKYVVFSSPYFPACGRRFPYSVRIRESTDQKKIYIWTLFTQWLFFLTICTDTDSESVKKNSSCEFVWFFGKNLWKIILNLLNTDFTKDSKSFHQYFNKTVQSFVVHRNFGKSFRISCKNSLIHIDVFRNPSNI